MAGQPTKYKERYNKQAYHASKLGYTGEELAEFLGVSISTITNWKNEYPEFLAAIKKGREEFDDGTVVNALLRRALGYEYKETVQTVDEKGNIKTKGAKVYTKQMPPDPTSMIFWLKNRQPARWRDKPEERPENDTAMTIAKAIRIFIDETDDKTEASSEDMPSE